MNVSILHVLATALLLNITLGGCQYTTGKGPVVEKEIALDPFSAIESEGSFDVQVTQGAVQKVVVVAQENITDKLRLNVLDGTLYISLEPGNYFNYDLDVRITVPTLWAVHQLGSGSIGLGTFVGLDKLEVTLNGSGDVANEDDAALEVAYDTELNLDGSGDIELNLKSKNINLVLKGSGDVQLSGVAETLDVDLIGSGDVNAYDLEVMDCAAQLDGSGSIKVYVTKHLKAELNGSGDILYKGEPKVEASIDGSGNIKAK